MDTKLLSLFQREATARLNAAEYELVSYTRACRGKIIDLHEMNHIRKLRERVEQARARQLKWTRHRFLAESGVL
ncbi:hypothetical protein [Hyphomicrobium sp. 99]|uniref:hypothetical protein n=1 Tax=Hyphomicrobium sp. 99 TaxID=1163419 RepID=UPI0005F801F6|nr:hypothetical protein [Hyphomicrobium sp. 99]